MRPVTETPKKRQLEFRPFLKHASDFFPSGISFMMRNQHLYLFLETQYYKSSRRGSKLFKKKEYFRADRYINIIFFYRKFWLEKN